jgi:hypothetical protein
MHAIVEMCMDRLHKTIRKKRFLKQIYLDGEERTVTIVVDEYIANK